MPGAILPVIVGVPQLSTAVGVAHWTCIQESRFVEVAGKVNIELVGQVTKRGLIVSVAQIESRFGRLTVRVKEQVEVLPFASTAV